MTVKEDDDDARSELDLSVFRDLTFDDQQVRMIVRDGEPWWVGRDICRALGVTNHRSSLALLAEDERGVHTMDSPSGQQKYAMVNLSGALRLILKSRRPDAERFRRWLVHDVVPSIMYTGSYSLPDVSEQYQLPRTHGEALRQLAQKVDELEVAEARLEIMTPKALRHDAWIADGESLNVRRVAKLLAQEGLVPAVSSERYLWKFLLEIRWVTRLRGGYTAVPRQMAMGRIREVATEFPDTATGEMRQGRPTVLITPQGVEVLRGFLAGLRSGNTVVKPIKAIEG